MPMCQLLPVNNVGVLLPSAAAARASLITHTCTWYIQYAYRRIHAYYLRGTVQPMGALLHVTRTKA